jgi:hypothetical protein
MAGNKVQVKIDTKEAIEELSQLIKLLKEADALIDSIASKGVKGLIGHQDNHQ